MRVGHVGDPEERLVVGLGPFEERRRTVMEAGRVAPTLRLDDVPAESLLEVKMNVLPVHTGQVAGLGPQHFAERRHLPGKRSVGHDAVVVRLAAGEHRRAARRADRGVGMGMLEAHSLCSQPVDVGRDGADWAAEGPDRVPVHVVGGEQQYVGLLGARALPGGPEADE